jgi:hypothetical protein
MGPNDEASTIEVNDKLQESLPKWAEGNHCKLYKSAPLPLLCDAFTVAIRNTVIEIPQMGYGEYFV